MPLSRRSLLAVPPLLFADLHQAVADPAAAPIVIQRFYGALLAVMKQAKQLTFDQRYQRLASAVAETFDLPLMTRIAVGPDWAQLATGQQQKLEGAFARYTISEYASRFDGYDGERFEVTPTASSNRSGVIVASHIVKSNGAPVALDYLMREEGDGSWKVIDVYLDGTISQLAARRSEFIAVLQRSGADGLVRMIEQRTARLRAG